MPTGSELGVEVGRAVDIFDTDRPARFEYRKVAETKVRGLLHCWELGNVVRGEIECLARIVEQSDRNESGHGLIGGRCDHEVGDRARTRVDHDVRERDVATVCAPEGVVECEFISSILS